MCKVRTAIGLLCEEMTGSNSECTVAWLEVSVSLWSLACQRFWLEAQGWVFGIVFLLSCYGVGTPVTPVTGQSWGLGGV